jgi:hypothetical protein
MNGPFSSSRLANLREKRPSHNENPFPQSTDFLTQSNNKNHWRCSYNKSPRISRRWTCWLEEPLLDSLRVGLREHLDHKNPTFKKRRLRELSIRKITITNESPQWGSVMLKKMTWNSSSTIHPNSIRKNPKSRWLLNSPSKSVFSSKRSSKKLSPKSNH